MKRFIPFVLWTLIIFALCSMPGKAIPKVSWLELLSFDKFVHASIFFIEQVLFMRALRPRLANAFIAFTFCVVYGGALELMQFYLFSERSGDVLDFIANTTGAFVGLLLFNKINKKLDFLPGY